MLPFYRLAPDCSLARVLRRDCRSGRDLGVVIERPALLNSLALCLVVDGGLATRQGSASGKRRARYPEFPRTNGFPKGNAFPSLTAARERQPSPAGGRRYAPARTDPPKRFFLLDRARPVLFLARPKREWGAHSRGNPANPPYQSFIPNFSAVFQKFHSFFS